MKGSEPNAPSGVLNLYKPTGPTSHDCVGRVRRALGTRKVGHAGTLDPLASGVLLIGIGNGTRVLEYLQGLPKVYRARLVLGITTDSQDITGAVLEERDASAVTRDQLSAALAPFCGELEQVPPMVSAIKMGGQKLYELARRGETVERPPRPITVYSVELLDFVPGERAEAEIRVRCSTGTYVRTLCHDLGTALGTGAAMTALEREAVGEFRATDAVELESLDAQTPLIDLAIAIHHLPSLTVTPEEATRLAWGQVIPAPDAPPEGPVRVLSESGELLAIASTRELEGERSLAPEKVFLQS